MSKKMPALSLNECRMIHRFTSRSKVSSIRRMSLSVKVRDFLPIPRSPSWNLPPQPPGIGCVSRAHIGLFIVSDYTVLVALRMILAVEVIESGCYCGTQCALAWMNARVGFLPHRSKIDVRSFIGMDGKSPPCSITHSASNNWSRYIVHMDVLRSSRMNIVYRSSHSLRRVCPFRNPHGCKRVTGFWQGFDMVWRIVRTRLSLAGCKRWMQITIQLFRVIKMWGVQMWSIGSGWQDVSTCFMGNFHWSDSYVCTWFHCGLSFLI